MTIPQEDVHKLLEAALSLRYWIETQQPGSLFHPSGKDVRKTEGYAQINQLLDKLFSDLSSSFPRWV